MAGAGSRPDGSDGEAGQCRTDQALEEFGKAAEFARRGEKPHPRQGGEIGVHTIGRVPESGADLSETSAKEARREMQMVDQKRVGVLNVDAEWVQSLGRKVSEVLRHNHVAAPNYRGSEHMAVVGIR